MTAALAPDALGARRKLKRFSVPVKVTNVNTLLLSHNSSGVHAEEIKVDV